MSLDRQTAVIKANPRQHWGGTLGNAETWAQLFRSYKPHDFGVMSAQTFASKLGKHQVNKPWYWLTEAQGRTMYLPGGTNHYKWSLMDDSHTRMTITYVDPNLGTTPGRDGEPFYVYGSRGWYHAPAVFKTERTDAPMIKIIGHPQEITPDIWRYTVKIQDGQEGSYIDPSLLQEGKTLVDMTSSVADESNYKYAGIETGSHYNLEAFIGYVARKLEMTDKFIRLEIGARKEGKSTGASYSFGGNKYHDGVGTGWMIYKRRDAAGKKDRTELLKAGHFMSTAEGLINDRIAMDLEGMMTFGRVQVDRDEDTGKMVTFGAGWHQMSRDGNYSEHQLDLTLDKLTQKLDATQYNTIEMENRKLYLKTGEVGIKLISRLIEAEYGSSPFANSELAGSIRRAQHLGIKNEKAFGVQFTEFQGFNGLTYCVMHDPVKDNPKYYPEIHPETGRPVESGSIDIIDLGESMATPPQAKTRSNLASVKEDAYEEYFMVSGVYDMQRGAERSGGNVPTNSKDCGIYRASSGKLEIWDINRTFRWAAIL